MRKYSDKLKERMAAQVLNPNGPSALSLSQKTGISQTALSKWAREFKNRTNELKQNKQKRPQDWTRAERFQAIKETIKLEGDALGAYLRKNGLTSGHISQWESEFLSGAPITNAGRKPKSREEKELIKENKALKRDLRRKNSALAEASALLVLKKKAQAIWGEREGEA